MVRTWIAQKQEDLTQCLQSSVHSKVGFKITFVVKKEREQIKLVNQTDIKIEGLFWTSHCA